MSRYPVIPTDSITDDYHGTIVPDPYRWLENPDSPETQAFIQVQNDLSEAYLRDCALRESIRVRMTALWDYPHYPSAIKRGDRYFFTHNPGSLNQPVLYRQTGVDGEPIVVFDPNALSDDGTVALTYWNITDDGKRMAYLLSRSGSDRQELHLIDIDTGHHYEEVIDHLRFANVAWLPDGSGFYYNRYPDPATVSPEDQQAYNRLYFHQVGTPATADRLVYERPDAKDLNFPPTLSDDGRYLLLDVWHGAINRNRVYYAELDGTGSETFVRLIDQPDAQYTFIDSSNTYLYFVTDLDAPRGRIIAIDTVNPAPDNWIEVIAESDEVISLAQIVAQRLIVVTLKDVTHRVRVYHLNGSFEHEIPLPTLGSVLQITGSARENELMLQFTSFLDPSSPWRYDFADQQLQPFKQTQLTVDRDRYETTQVFYPSKDGTPIPMFLIHKRGLERDGNAPTLLYGYGGFSSSLTPGFGVSILTWLEMGGIYAIANLRGGSEYGEAWHQAGMLAAKQTVFDDFIAAAEWLIAQGYTRTARLAIRGESNGGLLTAACMLQRPELFGAVICVVPVIDMLRYHKFSAGKYWIPEYGNAEADPEHFRFLYAYSPLHNVREGVTYPPILIQTAESDDRVVPMHALKFTATLQALAASDHAILLKVETKAGHGFGKPKAKIILEYRDCFAFLARVFDLTDEG
ncbi:MAG: prolyl oligopeptidase family serine peptidase [Anaerolineae bacterium]|nr:prolyl oligopeptidase family serine peptidase [Anaerolineae bacterium]